MLLSCGLIAQDCSEPTAQSSIDIGGVDAGYLNGGDMFWDFSNAHYEVPKGSGVHSIFAAAIWMSALDSNDELRVAAQTYRQSGSDFFSGPLCADGTILDDQCENFDRIWKVSQSDIDEQAELLDSGIDEAGLLPEAITQWPGKDNPHFTLFDLPQEKALAPFIDVDGDNIYNPLVGDVPRINGDQALWWVFNDIGAIHTESQGNPLGVEVSVLAYGFANDGLSDIHNQTFLEIEIYYPGKSSLIDFRFGYWVDSDLGEFDNDYIGCIVDENIGFTYDGDATGEGTWGDDVDIPVLGVKFLKGLSDFDGNDLGMTSFRGYNNDFGDNGNPGEPQHFANYMSGKNQDGEPLLNPDGEEVSVQFDGNPADPDAWTECSENSQPSDRRFIMASGPGFIPTNSRQKVHLGILWTDKVVYPCPDIAPLVSLGQDVEEQLAEVLAIPTSTGDGNCSDISADIVVDLIIEDDIEIYPNPVIHDSFNIALPEEMEEEILLRMLNVEGKEIQQSSLNAGNNQVIISRDLPVGTYFLLLESNMGSTSQKKVIVL